MRSCRLRCSCRLKRRSHLLHLWLLSSLLYTSGRLQSLPQSLSQDLPRCLLHCVFRTFARLVRTGVGDVSTSSARAGLGPVVGLTGVDGAIGVIKGLIFSSMSSVEVGLLPHNGRGSTMLVADCGVDGSGHCCEGSTIVSALSCIE